jgi:hypothetical protein
LLLWEQLLQHPGKTNNMRTTRINSAKRQMVQQDLQGLGNQEPDRMNQLPSKNLRQHDDINIAGKSSTGKKKQNSGKPDAKKESQK